jgi:hypothetical protein
MFIWFQQRQTLKLTKGRIFEQLRLESACFHNLGPQFVIHIIFQRLTPFRPTDTSRYGYWKRGNYLCGFDPLMDGLVRDPCRMILDATDILGDIRLVYTRTALSSLKMKL